MLFLNSCIYGHVYAHLCPHKQTYKDVCVLCVYDLIVSVGLKTWQLLFQLSKKQAENYHNDQLSNTINLHKGSIY